MLLSVPFCKSWPSPLFVDISKVMIIEPLVLAVVNFPPPPLALGLLSGLYQSMITEVAFLVSSASLRQFLWPGKIRLSNSTLLKYLYVEVMKRNFKRF